MPYMAAIIQMLNSTEHAQSVEAKAVIACVTCYLDCIKAKLRGETQVLAWVACTRHCATHVWCQGSQYTSPNTHEH